MKNQFVIYPKKGDIWVCNRISREDEYIVRESYDATALDLAIYDIIGVVGERNGDDILGVFKQNASNKWLNRWSWKLTGFTLDGTDRSGVLSIREATDSWAANVDYEIAYNASDKASLVSQLNTYFGANLTTQDWYAELKGEDIIVSCDCLSWQQQSYNAGKTGFTLTQYSLPETTALANITRRHGGTGGEGVISSWDRALAYFRADNSSTSYNPNTDVTSIKRNYPICLPGYLGTSQHQSDHCALLRSTYGEGEQGWLKFMASCLPVRPTDFGNMGQKFGEELGAKIGPQRFSTLAKTNQPVSPAFNYAYEAHTDTKPKGFFCMPTVDDLTAILDGLHYGTNSNRNSDPINDGLQRINGSAISNGSGLWSCCRSSSYYAWSASGGGGFFGSYGCLYSSNGVVPVAHLKVRKANP